MKTKLISLVSVILLSIGAIYADKVKIGDLYYNLNDADLTAEVAQSPLEPNYEGLTDIEIPSSVTYNDVQYSVTSIGDGAFDDCSYLTSVTIPNSVTTIGAMAFDWCASLTAVTIPNSVINIKSGAFYYCQGLSSLEIPSSVTNIENSAFFGCTRVTSITVDAGNPIYDSRDNCNAIVETASNTLILGCQNTIIPSSVISIGDGAYAGSGLDSIDIPNNITSIGDGAFSACFNLIWATIPISVTHMGEGVFQNCNGLSSVTISANVTDIGNNVFAGCYDLSSVNILSSITSIGDEAFRDCTQLKSITIPTSVTSIGSSAFGWCTVLNSIDIPNNVTSIGYGAFQMCSRLNSITCRATNAPNLEGDNAFSDVDKSIPIYVPSSSVSAYQAASGWSEFTNIQAIPSSEPDYKYYIVGSMNDWSVNENYEMTLNSESWATEYMIEIALTTASQFKVVKVDGENQTWYPDGMGNNYGENGEIAKDGTYTIYFRPNNDGGNDWFYNCIYADRHLVQEPVVLAALFPENGKPTAGIKVLGSFSADALDMELIEATGYYAHYSITATEEDVFYFRDAADEENVLYKKNYSGEWDTATFTFGDLWADDAWKGEPVKWVELDLNDNNQYAWKNAIQSSDGSKVKIGDLYYNLNEADLTAEVASQHNGSAYWLTEITTADIPASVTYNGVTYSVTSIRDSAFYSCNYLTSVTIPGSVTSIGASAFSGCGLLTSIDIPSSVTTIGHQAFLGCSKLTSITIPNSVTSIGFETFRSCSSLTSIIIPSSVTSIGEQAFMSCDGLTSVTIQNGVTSIGDFAFSTCWKLTAIDIPSSVTTIGRQAFNNCFTLTSVTIPSSVTSIGDGAFSACFGLTSMSVESGNSVYDSRDNCNAIIETATNTLVAGCQNTVIPSSVTSIGLNAFSYCSSLTSIVIPSSVISIGDGAFSSCSSLTSIDIPSSVTSIGQYAFSYCRGLTSIEIPGSVVSIGSVAFSDCSNLTAVTISNGVTSIESSAFSSCSRLTSIDIPSSVTSIGQMAFSNCSGLTSITCRSTNTPSMGNSVFSDVSKSIPLYVPSSSVAAYQAAEGWSEFTNIQAIPDDEGEATTVASGYCGAEGDGTNLTWTYTSDSVLTISGSGAMADWNFLTTGNYDDVPSWSDYMIKIKALVINEGVTNIGNAAFYSCASLISIDLPSSLTSIGDWAFSSCSELSNFVVPRNVSSLGTNIFNRSSNLLSLSVENGNAKYDSRNNCNAVIETSTNTLVLGCQSTIIPSSVTGIGDYAFTYSQNLTTIDIPNSVTSIGDGAFNGCTNLNTIILPNNITYIGEFAFNSCSFVDINIPASVTNIGSYAFAYCSGLTSITCEVTNPPTLGNNTFDEVDKYIPLYVPSGSVEAYQVAEGWSEFTNIQEISSSDGSKVRIGDLYYNLNVDAQTAEVTSQDSEYPYWSISLTTVDIPASIVYRGVTYSVTSIGTAAFGGCAELTSVTIPSSVTSIGNMAFFGCYALSSIDIPSSVTSIGEYAFEYCSLNSIDFPNSVTSIGEWAFSQCNNLTSVTIPSSVTNIGNNAFSDCSSLTSIIVESGNPVYDSRDNCNAIIETATNTLFMGCQSTVIPSSVTSIGFTAFYNCHSLTSIDIPSSVTSIGSLAFGDCSGLTSVTIPSSVTNIGGTAFRYCSGLTSITCQAASAPELGDNVFEDVDKSIPLYVPSSSVSAYQAASGWSEFTNIRAIGGNSGGNTPLFPGDPGTLTLNLELKAAVMDGEEILGYEPTGGGGYAKGSSVTITAQEIRGYEFVQWSDSITDMQRTIVLDQSMTLTALYSHSMIEIPVAANKWTFICLPPLGDRQYTEDMFTYDGLTDVQWGTYNGAKRAAGQSGWETPETFNALQGYIIFSTTAGTLRINAYQDEIRQGESGNTIYAGMIDYASSHAQNANWNFVGNPFSQGYSIAGFAAAGITSPVTVWNGVGYTTYTPGIDSYILNPFEAFFIQKAENGAEGITFNPEYLEGDDGGNSGSADDGALSGAFSVAAGTQIHFSKGNLQYQASTDTWRFAENQYDMIGNDNANISDSYSGWIDMFGWGTGNNPANSSTDYNDYSTFVDWGINAISNGGNKANLWRTLTNDEWGYLFYDRPNASGKYGKATVAGINGIIVLPDDFNGLGINTSRSAWDNNTFSAEDWAAYEADGAVFLPAAGYREGADVSGVGSVGNYWSSTPSSEPSAYNLLLDSNGINPQDAYYRYRGRSVRLVR